MADDPMLVLLRLRRMGVDEATRGLAACLRAETEAAAAVRAIDDAIARETEAASDPEAGDHAVEAFAVWYRRARQERDAMVAVLHAAETATAEARTVMAASRTGVRVAEELIDRRDTMREAAAERAEQRLLDEVAARRSR